MRHKTVPLLVSILSSAGIVLGAEATSKVAKPDFNKQIKPILEAACVHCHNDKEHKADFKITTLDEAKNGGGKTPGIVPG